MTGYIEHLESHLGTMSGGSSGDETTPTGVRVAFFGADRPFPGVRTVVTVGVHAWHLELPNGNFVHQELLMHVPEAYPGYAAGVLFDVARWVGRRRHALRPHEVIRLGGHVFRDTEMTALVAVPPQYMPDSFAVCEAAEVPIVMVWLVPLTAGEADLVDRSGWAALERILVAEDPDLSDPGRPEVPLLG